MSDAGDSNASSDTSISQSTKEESCSNKDPKASTDSKTGTSQPTTEGQSCEDKNPDASLNTKISISQSTKDESCSNEDPKASTDSKTGTSQATTGGQSCDDINPDASSDTSISQSTAKNESCSNEDPKASTDSKTGTSQPTTEGQSCDDINPDASLDTKISISQSTAKKESCSNEDPKASTDTQTGTSQPTTEGQSCEDINPDASSDTSISQSTTKDESCSNEDAEASTDEMTALLKPTTDKELSRDADPEAPSGTSPLETRPSFDDQTVRRAFVQKVFGIEILILLFAFGVVCLFTFSDVIRIGMRRNFEVFISSIIIFIAVIIILSIFQSFSRRHPWNLVGLAVVTLTFSFMLGTTASYINTTSVFFGVGDTIITFLAIIAFNAQSRVVYNFFLGYFLSLAVLLIMCGITYGITNWIFSDGLFFWYVVFGGLGASLLSMIFVFELQLMMGRMKGRVRPEEYATAALFLYLDIMLFFIWIIKLPLSRLYRKICHS